MPGIRGIGQKAPTRRPVLATRASLAQARGRARDGPNWAKIGALHRRTGPSRGRSGSRRPKPPNHDPNGFAGQTLLLARAATAADGRLQPDDSKHTMSGSAASGQILFRSREVDGLAMTGEQGKGAGKAGADVKDSRRDRLKLALRENLKRRKSQARGRSDADAASSGSPDFPLDDASGEKPGS